MFLLNVVPKHAIGSNVIRETYKQIALEPPLAPVFLPSDVPVEVKPVPIAPKMASISLESAPQQEILEMIVEDALDRGYPVQKAVEIAKAESELKNVCNHKYDGENGMYTACGPFQITRTTYKAFCGDPAERLEIDKNIDCAFEILEESGDHHWDESRATWGAKIDELDL